MCGQPSGKRKNDNDQSQTVAWGGWGQHGSPMAHWFTFGLVMFMVFGGWKLMPWFAIALGGYLLWTKFGHTWSTDDSDAGKPKRKNDDAEGFETVADEPLRQV